MRPIIPFITIQAIYLSALMRVLFRFASSTEQGIKLTKEKREKKKSAACVRLLQITYYLLLFIYPSIYYWNFGVLRNNFTIISQLQLLFRFPLLYIRYKSRLCAITSQFFHICNYYLVSPSIYYWNFETLGTNFTIISQLAAYVIKLVYANTFCKLFVQPFRLVSFCTFV